MPCDICQEVTIFCALEYLLRALASVKHFGPSVRLAGQKAAAYIPGTEANRESKDSQYEQGYRSTPGTGQGSGHTGTGTGSGYNTGSGTGNTGGYSGTGSGYNSGSGYGNDNSSGYGSGTGTGDNRSGTAGMTAGEHMPIAVQGHPLHARR